MRCLVAASTFVGVTGMMLVMMSSVSGCKEKPDSPEVAEDPPTKVNSDTRPIERAQLYKSSGTLLDVLVTKDGLVRYGDLMSEPRLTMLVEICHGFATLRSFESASDELAFLCNAYNLNVLQLVADHQRETGEPLESVMDIEGFFDEVEITVRGETMTLNELENDHIRPFGDARIHAALVCAAMSCPPLRNEPFRGATLDEQFDDQCRRWVNDPTKYDVADGSVSVSRIFEWYGADFEGSPWNGVLGFLRHYADADSPLGQRLSTPSDPEVRWMEYDWSLNDGSSKGAS